MLLLSYKFLVLAIQLCFVSHFHMVSITSPVDSLDLNVMFVVPIFSNINLVGSLPVTSKIAWCYTE